MTTYWVDMESGDDSKSGLSLEEAVKTPEAAYRLMGAPQEDVVITIEPPPRRWMFGYLWKLIKRRKS